jgi:mTERF domain-containing protein
MESVVKPNVALLGECGLNAFEIANMFLGGPKLINTKQERLSEMVVCNEDLGVPSGSGRFVGRCRLSHASIRTLFLPHRT